MVAVTDTNGCSAADSTDVVFNSLPAVNAGPDVTADCSDGVLLAGNGSGALSWQPASGLSDPGVAQPIALPAVTTTYTLTASNGGCIATDEVVVTVDCNFIFVPGAFSPNNDGVNDVFRAMGKDIAKFDMKIFNRWGELIFETQYPDIGWDGTYKNLPEQVGAYVWVIDATDSEGKKLLINGKNSGNVTLLR
jgi:gliding motility-associated-like protein